MKSIFCSCLFVVALLLTPSAHALSISYTDSIAQTLTNWSSNLSVSQFDPSLGTLDSITLIMAASLDDGYVHYVSTATGVTKLWGSIAASISVQSPTTGTLMVEALPLLVIASSVNRISVFPMTTGDTAHGSASDTQINTLLYSDLSIADKLAFVGTGSVYLPISATSSTGFNVLGSNLSLTPIIVSSGLVTVTYNYTAESPAPVPEPASLLLLGSGALLSGYAARRRKRLLE